MSLVKIIQRRYQPKSLNNKCKENFTHFFNYSEINDINSLKVVHNKVHYYVPVE